MEGFDDWDVIKPFKEKKWFKDQDGQNITNGYTLRGKYCFKNAVEGLIKTLQKGVSGEIEGVPYRTLDVRKNGTALEVEVEMLDKGEREKGTGKKGIAMVKLYGPYDQKDKKDNVVMVTKSKQSDSNFVTILAEKIIKPLITKFTNGDTASNKSSEKVKEDAHKCPFCGKSFKSSPGMKGHITKKTSRRKEIKT